MPTHKIFEEYAKRIENEMKPHHRKDNLKIDYKICGVCEEKNDRSAEFCSYCENEFPSVKLTIKNAIIANNLILSILSPAYIVDQTL